jgi:mono/diheme cytochrome c family protein
MRTGKARRVTFAFLGALAGLVVGCSAHKQPSKVETALADMAKDVVIPIEAESHKNPLPDNPAVLQQGWEIYMQSCALCHGADGHAGTGLGRAMYPPAMDLTSPHVQHWTDAELYWIIQNGLRLTGMPSWKSMPSEADAWKPARFIHNLPRMPTPTVAQAEKPSTAGIPEAKLVAYGKTLHRQEGCFMCHQLNGEGGKVGPDLSSEGTRGRTNEWLTGHFKDPQAYTKGSMMLPFENLTDAQLQALSAFLQDQKGPKP